MGTLHLHLLLYSDLQCFIFVTYFYTLLSNGNFMSYSVKLAHCHHITNFKKKYVTKFVCLLK